MSLDTQGPGAVSQPATSHGRLAPPGDISNSHAKAIGGPRNRGGLAARLVDVQVDAGEDQRPEHRREQPRPDPFQRVDVRPVVMGRRHVEGRARRRRNKHAGMDAIGAQHLRRAIEQQRHWRQAVAVREGRQPVRDPDVSQLVDFDGLRRRYRSSDGKVFEKRLLDGCWI